MPLFDKALRTLAMLPGAIINRVLQRPSQKAAPAKDGAFAVPSEVAKNAEQLVRMEKILSRIAAMQKRQQFLPLQESHTAETAEMRAAYRVMLREPHVKASLLTKVLGVAALDAQVQPGGMRPIDKDASDFVKDALQASQGGTRSLVIKILFGGLIEGYSVCEKVKYVVTRGRWAGKWSLKGLKAKDPNELDLLGDEYRNITGIKDRRSNEEFHPSNFVIFQHLPLYENATGMSDFRAAYRAYWLKNTAWQLRSIGMERYGLPIVYGTYVPGQDDTKTELEAMLPLLRSQSWFTIPEGARVQALELASRGQADFESAIRQLDEEIVLGITGAVLQMLQGQVSDGRGSSDVHRSTSELLQWFLAAEIGDIISDQLVPDLVDPNFEGAEYPRVTFGGVNDASMTASLAIDSGLLMNCSLPLSKKELYQRYGRQEPTEEEDRLTPPSQAQSVGPLGVASGGLLPGGQQQGRFTPFDETMQPLSLDKSRALGELQKAYFNGELNRDAAIANAVYTMGVDHRQAQALFPMVEEEEVTAQSEGSDDDNHGGFDEFWQAFRTRNNTTGVQTDSGDKIYGSKARDFIAAQTAPPAMPRPPKPTREMYVRALTKGQDGVVRVLDHATVDKLIASVNKNLTAKETNDLYDAVAGSSGHRPMRKQAALTALKHLLNEVWMSNHLTDEVGKALRGTKHAEDGEGEPYWILNVPDIRQMRPWDCGAAAVMSVDQFFHPSHAARLDDYKRELFTNSYDGTRPVAIIRYFQAAGNRVSAGKKSVELLRKFTLAGWPVLCCIQQEQAESFEGGHWVVVRGCDEQFIWLQDPSFGRVKWPLSAFTKRWHDKDANGNPLVQFGIGVGLGQFDDGDDAAFVGPSDDLFEDDDAEDFGEGPEQGTFEEFAWVPFKTKRNTIGVMDGDKRLYGKAAQKALSSAAAKQVAPKQAAQPAEAKHPWAGATVEDESRWHGSKVTVSPSDELAKRGEGTMRGTVTRVLNRGELIEYKPEGSDIAWRVPASRVKVDEVADSRPGKPVAEVAQPETPKPADVNEPKKDFRAQLDDALAGSGDNYHSNIEAGRAKAMTNRQVMKTVTDMLNGPNAYRGQRMVAAMRDSGYLTDARFFSKAAPNEQAIVRTLAGQEPVDKNNMILRVIKDLDLEKVPARIIGVKYANAGTQYLLESATGRREAVDGRYLETLMARHPGATIHLSQHKERPIALVSGKETVAGVVPLATNGSAQTAEIAKGSKPGLTDIALPGPHVGKAQVGAEKTTSGRKSFQVGAGYGTDQAVVVNVRQLSRGGPEWEVVNEFPKLRSNIAWQDPKNRPKHYKQATDEVLSPGMSKAEAKAKAIQIVEHAHGIDADGKLIFKPREVEPAPVQASPPKPPSNRAIKRRLADIDAKLVERAIEKWNASKGASDWLSSDHRGVMFAGMRGRKLSQSDRDTLNEYLFGSTKGVNADELSEHDDDQETLPIVDESVAPKPPEQDVAGSHADAIKVQILLNQAEREGAQTLAQITQEAVARHLATGRDFAQVSKLFDDEETKRLADALAKTIGTATIAGRARVEKLKVAAEEREKAGLVKFGDEPAFSSFADTPLQPMIPELALSYFQRLIPTLSGDPHQFGDGVRRTAFTLAAASELQVLDRVKRAIASAIESGQSGHGATIQIQDILNDAGVTMRNPQYAEMVFRTNTLDSYNQGVSDQLAASSDFFPAWEYLGIRDGRQRPEHEIHFNKLFPASVPFATVRDSVKLSPWNCRCTSRPISRAMLAVMEASGRTIEKFNTFSEQPRQAPPAEPQIFKNVQVFQRDGDGFVLRKEEWDEPVKPEAKE